MGMVLVLTYTSSVNMVLRKLRTAVLKMIIKSNDSSFGTRMSRYIDIMYSKEYLQSHFMH